MKLRFNTLSALIISFTSTPLVACGKGEPAPQAAAPAPSAPAEAEPAKAPAAEPTPAPKEAPAEAKPEEAKPAENPPAEPAEKPPTPAEEPAAEDGDGPPDMAEQALQTHANDLMKAWLAAQNEGDFDRYAALYASDFKGVRRTATGAPKELDLEGWKADRQKMFQKKMDVAADDITISADTTPGVTVVSFTQRWRTGKYADHGQKVIKLRAGDDGQLRIIVEDMRTSTAGWEDARVKAADLTTMTSPLTMRVTVDRRQPKDAVGDCAGGTMELVVEDASGRKETIEVGNVTGLTRDEPPTSKTRLAPSKKGRYEDLGEWCGGLQAGWRVDKDGDFITGTDIWVDEVTGNGRQRWVLAKLPAGAEVSFK